MTGRRVHEENNAEGMRLLAERFHGERLKSLQVPGFILSERKYPPSFETPLHSHRRALFCLAIEGAYTARYGPRTCTCEPSSLLFYAPDEIHSDRFHDSGGRFFIIEIDTWWLEKAREQVAIIDSSADFSGGDLTLFALNLYKEFLETDDVSPLIVEGLMLALIGKISRSARATLGAHAPRWLEQARELMRDRFRETLTLAEIASEVGVNPTYLSRVFQQHYQSTIGEYLRRLRIEFACHALITSNAPLCQIALAAGFSDQSHFTRLFKRQMGLPPAKYRESLARP